jgi:DNA primase
VVALAQFDINYVVATLGTATTHEHLERLFRTVPEVVFCFDGDRAGREAAWRALVNTLPVLRDGREARFLFLPDGEDPDSLVRKIGRDAFEQRIVDAVHLSEFFFERLSAQLDLDSIDGRARLVDLARPLLAKLPDSMFHQLMVERLAELAHTASGRLAGHLEPRPPSPDTPRSTPARQPRTDKKSAVRQAVELLLHQPSLAEKLQRPAFLEHCDLPGIPLLLELLDLLDSQPGLNTAAILEHWRGREESRYLSRLASWTPELENPDLQQDLQGLVVDIQRQHIEKRLEFLNQEQTRRKLSETEVREYWELHQQSHATRQRG